MKRALLFFGAMLLVLSSGCARVAVRWSDPVVQNMVHSVFEECDLHLAREALPANLKILEGLAKTDPGNRTVLTALAMGFSGYALLFVEEDEPERASGLYLRARDYALHALGRKSGDLSLPNFGEADQTLSDLGREDLQPLFWAAFAWNAWVNLNLDKPEGIAQLEKTQFLLEKVLVLDSTYFYALPSILQGAMLSAKPALLGGDREKAKAFFQKGVAASEGRFFPARYYYARYYAVAAQDRGLFRELLQGIMRSDPQELREACLINRAFQQKAAKLAEREEELFF